MEQTPSRRRALALLGSTVLALATKGAAALPDPQNAPLVVTESEGLVFLTFLDLSFSPHKKTGSPNKASRSLNNWFYTHLLNRSRHTLRRIHKPQAAGKAVSGVYNSLLHRPATGRAGETALFSPNILVLTAAVAAVGLTLDESLSAVLTIGESSFAATLDARQSFSGGSGKTVQLDYSTLPDLAAESLVYVALLRDTSAPGVGVLVAVALDASLPTALAPFGMTNADFPNGTSVTVTYDVTLTGSTSGTHTSSGPTFTDTYYAVQDIIGVGVPPELLAQIQQLLAGLNSQNLTV